MWQCQNIYFMNVVGICCLLVVGGGDYCRGLYLSSFSRSLVFNCNINKNRSKIRHEWRWINNGWACIFVYVLALGIWFWFICFFRLFSYLWEHCSRRTLPKVNDPICSEFTTISRNENQKRTQCILYYTSICIIYVVDCTTFNLFLAYFIFQALDDSFNNVRLI